MRRVSKHKGFWLSYIINMIFRAEWIAASIILFLLYKYFKFEILLWISIFCLGVWIIYPLIVTILLRWAGKVGSEPTPYRENKNPYSNKSQK